MTNNRQPYKFLISGGGTGGHIFPAVAIARELEKVHPGCEILFAGANNRMEMEKVPLEGYKIVGFDVAGLKRSFSLSNVSTIFKFIGSYFKAKKLIRSYNPDCVIGTGGYASLAVLYAATSLNRKTLIWEGNGYAGLTNKILAKRVNIICTGFEGMEKVFPKEKVIVSGNPVRENLNTLPNMAEARRFFNLSTDKPVVFITGGSLGARTINQAIQSNIAKLHQAGLQLIWQTGKNFQADLQSFDGIVASSFIREMDMAYAASDIVVSRAGALTLAEIAVADKPAILVPSPNVTDDHQTHNALQFSQPGAGVLITDKDCATLLADRVIALANDKEKQEQMKERLKALAKPDATQRIVEQINRLITA